MKKEDFGKELKSCFINMILVMILGFILILLLTSDDSFLVYSIMFNSICICGTILRAIYLLYVYMEKHKKLYISWNIVWFLHLISIFVSSSIEKQIIWYLII